MKHLLLVCLAFAQMGVSQTLEPLDWQSKLSLHSNRAFGTVGLIKSAASAALAQRSDTPDEWGQGMSGYGKRFGSTLAGSGVRNGLAFGLDVALRQDPRYYRAGDGGLMHRMMHTVRGTILTRTDSGGETLSTWRIGSAYGAAFINNQWQPDRLNTTSHALTVGTSQIGFDLLGNLIKEFLPDVKAKFIHHKP